MSIVWCKGTFLSTKKILPENKLSLFRATEVKLKIWELASLVKIIPTLGWVKVRLGWVRVN
jgi:hypothetical protein